MIVVCGEALFDVFAEGDTATGMAMDARIGGSPFNVAMGLARLGRPVAFLGAVGSGFAGQRLLRALKEEGIDTACTPVLDAPTTLSLVGLNAQGVPSYAFYGEGCADRLLPMAALQTIPAAARAFQFGSYAMVVEPVAQVQRALVERVRHRTRCGRSCIRGPRRRSSWHSARCERSGCGAPPRRPAGPGRASGPPWPSR